MLWLEAPGLGGILRQLWVVGGETLGAPPGVAHVWVALGDG